MTTLFTIYSWLLVWLFGLYITSFVFVIVMAQDRGRNVVGWLLLGLICPVLIMFFLLCLGETYSKKIERIIQEEKIRERIKEGWMPKSQFEKERKALFKSMQKRAY